MSARSFCKSNGMDLVAIESEHEENYFMGKCRENIDWFEGVSHIGGVSTAVEGKESWYWITSVKKVNINLNLDTNEVDQKAEKNCLQLVRNQDQFFYQRTNCFEGEPQSFVCQRIIYKKSDVSKWQCDIFPFLCDT